MKHTKSKAYVNTKYKMGNPIIPNCHHSFVYNIF